jgi:hypothetical protein
MLLVGTLVFRDESDAYRAAAKLKTVLPPETTRFRFSPHPTSQKEYRDYWDIQVYAVAVETFYDINWLLSRYVKQHLSKSSGYRDVILEQFVEQS